MDRDRAELLETAADWADRFGELTEAERRELSAWLEESAEHAQAFAQIRRLMTDTALIEALEQPEPRAESAPLPAARSTRHSRNRSPRGAAPVLARRQAMVAGLASALALPLAGYWLLHQHKEVAPSQPLRFASAVGKRRHVVLPDGSGLLLDASSVVTVHFSGDRRRIVLDQGAARFDVHHDASRPFEVHTPLATMVALGTSFSVDHLSDASELRVFSGRVQLDARNGRSLVFPARQWALVNG
ncbi:MAG: FecR domain-containing protein, partial [Novosphingobium sp.]